MGKKKNRGNKKKGGRGGNNNKPPPNQPSSSDPPPASDTNVNANNKNDKVNVDGAPLKKQYCGRREVTPSPANSRPTTPVTVGIVDAGVTNELLKDVVQCEDEVEKMKMKDDVEVKNDSSVKSVGDDDGEMVQQQQLNQDEDGGIIMEESKNHSAAGVLASSGDTTSDADGDGFAAAAEKAGDADTATAASNEEEKVEPSTTEEKDEPTTEISDEAEKVVATGEAESEKVASATKEESANNDEEQKILESPNNNAALSVQEEDFEVKADLISSSNNSDDIVKANEDISDLSETMDKKRTASEEQQWYVHTPPSDLMDEATIESTNNTKDDVSPISEDASTSSRDDPACKSEEPTPTDIISAKDVPGGVNEQSAAAAEADKPKVPSSPTTDSPVRNDIRFMRSFSSENFDNNSPQSSPTKKGRAFSTLSSQSSQQMEEVDLDAPPDPQEEGEEACSSPPLVRAFNGTPNGISPATHNSLSFTFQDATEREAFAFLTASMREKLGEGAANIPDETLSRYIRWKPDVKRAADRYCAYQTFRKDNPYIFDEKPLQLSQDPKLLYLIQNGMVIAPEELVAKDGSSVMIVRGAKCDVAAHKCDDQTASRAIFYVLQSILERRTFDPLKGITVVLDLTGVSRRNVPKKLANFLSKAKDCFPLRIRAIYVVAMPWWFPSNSTTKLFSTTMRSRIHFLKSTVALSEYIEKDRLLVEDGGIYHFDLQEWISATVLREVETAATQHSC